MKVVKAKNKKLKVKKKNILNSGLNSVKTLKSV